jgi:hypothetical protein
MSGDLTRVRLERCVQLFIYSRALRISFGLRLRYFFRTLSVFFTLYFCHSPAFLTDHSLSRAETSQIVISTPNLQRLAPTPTPTQKTDTGRTPLPGAQAGRAQRKPWQPRCGSRGFSRGRVRSFLFVFIPIAYIFLTSRYFCAARRSFFFFTRVCVFLGLI